MDEPNRLVHYNYSFSVWNGKTLSNTPAFSPRPRIFFRGFVGNRLGGGMNTLMDPFNEPRDADDLVGLYLVQATDIGGLSMNDPKIHGLFMDYRLYTTQIKQSASGQTVSDTSIRPPTEPSLPYLAILGPKQPFVDYGITEFTSDASAYLVASEADCQGRANCLVYDQIARKLHVRLTGDAQVHVNDDLGLIKFLQVDPMPGSAQFFIRQANREHIEVKANLRFFKNQVIYRGDITGLSSELGGNLVSLRNGEVETGNDYASFNSKYSGKLTKKAYLVMKNKQMLYGNFQKKPPFVTEFELVYMLEEAETVAQAVYGADYASGIQISKSQWLKAYGDKDTSDVGLNPFMSLIAGGTTFSGTPVLRLPLVDGYIPGWIEDRDGSLVNFAHIYSAVAFGDLQESDLRNGLRALGYSYAGDRIFSYGYFGAYLFCSVLCWNDKALALNNAVNEAPPDEIIGDYYALDLYSQFRHNPAHLSSVLRGYFGIETQKSSKDRALGEVATFGYLLGN
ncbi:hypothetical protein HY994_00145 [Candidatus Micrarchaeota archaeon]|nr:hypothetical protein [Candidatus Micrarchaeota archaeon]